MHTAAPWIGTIVTPAAQLLPDLLPVIADFERVLGWVWMECKKHGNTGKKNASKGGGRDNYLHLRCTSEAKAEWSAAAEKKGMKLSQWITHVADFAAKEK